MTNKGWECVRCGNIWGPHVDKCKDCEDPLRKIYAMKRKATLSNIDYFGFTPPGVNMFHYWLR